MSTIINHVPTIFPPAKVETIAAEMQARDDEWTYRVKHDPKGKGGSLIEVFDEDGEFVDYV